jgi:outer membrane protein TolC/ABC-type uncharacterized transport system substrate-binding protein
MWRQWNMSKGWFACTGLLLAALLVPSIHEASAQNREVRIGVVSDGPWEGGEAIGEAFIREILDLTLGEFDVRFPQEKSLEADWTPAGVRSALDQLLADPEVDLVLAFGVLVASDAAQRRDMPKPVIAPFVLDADIEGLPRRDGASGVKNFNYLQSTLSTARQFEVFRELAPFKRLALLGADVFLNVAPAVEQRVREAIQALGAEAVVLPVGDSADEALGRIPANVDAVFLAPLVHLKLTEYDGLIAGLNKRRLPTFSHVGRDDVERGVLAGISDSWSYDRRARRVALNVQRILLGEDAGTLPVTFPEREQLYINMSTARAIDVYPSFSLATVAQLLEEERTDIPRQLSLRRVVDEAVAVNLDLAVAERLVSSGSQDVGKARSALLPQIHVSALGTLIDRDRADASFGTVGRRTLTPSATVSQLIYSEPVRANLDIQRDLQRVRELDRDSVNLDIRQQAATAYLNVLRAKTFERIQRSNLDLTRSNLDLARARREVGYSGPADVYRWESAIATDRRRVIQANSQRNVAEIALNRLLHQPLELPFGTEEIGLEDPALRFVQEELYPYASSLGRFRVFREFMVAEALAAYPELQGLDAAIAARERSLRARERAFFAPEVALQGDVSRAFKGGTRSPSFGAGLPDLSSAFPQQDDFNWSVGLSVSFPLWTSGFKTAARDQERDELERLRLERRATRERVEQRLRSALHLAGGSFAGIDLAQEAAEAARRNLELTTAAYSRGTVPILDLLDAQNAALRAEEASANAIYDFLIDFMEVERASGRFHIFESAETRREWLERVDRFFQERGASLDVGVTR